VTEATTADATEELDSDALLEVLTAFRAGDFSVRLPATWIGKPGKIADTLNAIIAANQRCTEELERVGQMVGKDGRINERLSSTGWRGGWERSVRAVDDLIEDLIRPNDEIARVIGAVARGDLSQSVPMEVDGRVLKGHFAGTARTVNTMVGQLSAFSSEVTRVAREVGTEGVLGNQAEVPGVSGVWKDLTDSVNQMAANLTAQVRNIAEVTTAVANGDLSRKITVEGEGEILELKSTINVMVDQLNTFAAEVTRVAREVGTEGRLGGQAHVSGVSGVWKDLTDNVNEMAANLTAQVRNIAEVTTAVANGDLSRKITVEGEGEILELKSTINVMVDRLNAFASEVTRVAREVGTEGKLGGQAHVPGAAGIWEDLTDNVNLLAAQLTQQIRNIAEVTTAVANGDLSKKVTVDVQGEILELKSTINVMVDQLNAFTREVTRVAREVGTEGKLGGQAMVPGVAGIWKDLAENVNQLADTLTEQIRAIAEVATAVTEGDLTRSIGVEASGEVAALKDTLNEMIRNLRETTRRNTEQDWLKTHLSRFDRMLQGQRDLNTVSGLILSELARLISAQHGIFYTVDLGNPEEPLLRYQAGYAAKSNGDVTPVFRLGEGLVGQCAVEKRPIMLDDVPGDYIAIASGLGKAPPASIIVLPVLFEGQVRAVIELASFQRFNPLHLDFLDQLTDSIGVVINTIEANSRTEELLAQSQSLAGELQTQQEELRQTNDELEQKARLLAEQNSEVERKNLEVELARRSLEEKAEQLAETSRYKSEFLANMSHELRTPLNSMLILAEQLADNPDGNLSPRQTEFAKIIWSSGQDLLALINDILDLSKIESGTVSLEVSEESCEALRDVLDRSFHPVAERKQLRFSITLEPGLPRLRTDSKRLQQILKNLLSNAFKFTEKGSVEMSVRSARDGWDAQIETLQDASQVVAFEVVDTGIGIARDKQEVIFDAFKQADGTTSRKFGGTGLGLSISRELIRLLGGQISVSSEAGVGSRFTVYLPVEAPSQVGELVSRRDSPSVLAAARMQAPDVEDDRESIEAGDAAVLIVEDDTNFARVLLDLARRNGFKAVVARDGREAIELAHRLRPAAVTLDIGLRDISGWKVLEALREDPTTERTPVHVVSVFEDGRGRVAEGGASSFHSKPVSRRTLERLFRTLSRPGQRGPRLLMVGGEVGRRKGIAEAAAKVGIDLLIAEDADEARRLLQDERVDCLLLDMRLPSSAELLERLRRSRRLKALPVVSLAGEADGVDPGLHHLAGQVVVVATLPAEELIEEVERVLGGGERSERKEEQRDGIGQEPPTPPIGVALPDEYAISLLSGHRALVVDDDVRNVFALTALLERYGMQVQTAESGDEAIEKLQADPEIEVVLLDVMMPDKDGYTTMREIRAISSLGDIPIIAVTAKAMKGDRERCLEAGATDYVAKPVDPERLVAMLVETLELS
jgi:signal transduction histidine kinase/CheY-like chemotaxis protein/HAMP domain-containing protein